MVFVKDRLSFLILPEGGSSIVKTEFVDRVLIQSGEMSFLSINGAHRFIFNLFDPKLQSEDIS